MLRESHAVHERVAKSAEGARDGAAEGGDQDSAGPSLGRVRAAACETTQILSEGGAGVGRGVASARASHHQQGAGKAAERAFRTARAPRPGRPAPHAQLGAAQTPTDLEHFVHLLLAQVFATLLSQPGLDQVPAYPVIFGENLKQNLSML